jgi:hypothetical protein
LDFDRAGLDVLDRIGLTMEATRQLAEQLGASCSELMDARLDAGLVTVRDTKAQLSIRQQLPKSLASQLGKAVAASGRPVLVVLDTLEVLRGRGETHPEELFKWLDALVTKGVKPMHVLAAGRGDALDSLPEIDLAGATGSPNGQPPGRVIRLELPGLEDDAALALLARLEVPEHLRHELLELAQGNPLKLRLAAEVAKRSGIESLPKHKRGAEVSAAFLYRLLLSRITDPDLKRLAHPGLVVRRINAELIRKVLAPALGLGAITEQRANDLLTQLATHHWLVENDPGAPGFLKHLSHMRKVLLPLLYRSAPRQSARIDAAAIHWFAAQPSNWAQVESVYHQLQLTRVNPATPSVPANIAAQFDDDTLEELPLAAADLVRVSRGGRSSQFRPSQAVVSGWADDTGVVRELLAVVQRQDWTEGVSIVRSVMDAQGLDMRSQMADAIRMFYWRSGQWAKARHWLTERDRFDDSDGDLSNLPEPLALARLEMRAAFNPEGLRRHWQMWRPILPSLERASVVAVDNAARRGALSLLLPNLPDPFHFSSTDSRDCDVAAAANERWNGGLGNESRRAETLGRERMGRVLPPNYSTEPLLPGRLLATLTPYAVFVSNLSVLAEHADLREAATLATSAISLGGGLISESQIEPVKPVTGDPVVWLTHFGLFAEWAEARAFIHRDADLKLISRAAERWRRTIAGNWSIGQRRGGWRNHPPIDETLRKRLEVLLGGPTPTDQAHEELAMWAKALGTDALLPLLRRRLDGALAETEQARSTSTPERITQRLLARGTPAAFAPALTVLILRGAF